MRMGRKGTERVEFVTREQIQKDLKRKNKFLIQFSFPQILLFPLLTDAKGKEDEL